MVNYKECWLCEENHENSKNGQCGIWLASYPLSNMCEGGGLPLQLKRPEREAENWPPSSNEFKYIFSYTSTLPYAIIPLCLIMHSRDNLASDL